MPPSPFSPYAFPWRNVTPWTCRTCLRSRNVTRSIRNQTIATKIAPQNGARPQRRKLLVLAAGSGTLVAGAMTLTDQGKHAVTATQRSSRVASTLYVNIMEYRRTLKLSDDPDYDRLLKACHKRCAVRTLKTLEKNGSIFIKLGQHLSSLNYLLPSEWCETFIPLQDKCPVSSYESIEEMVRHDTGQSLDEMFTSFEHEPLGAASLAQVHRAYHRETGEKVAVKVQHPALEEWAKLDLALTSFTFATLKRFFPEYDLTWLSDEMQNSLPKELDFREEGRNAMRAREYFANIPSLPLVIPRVLSAERRILVMEYVSGHRPDDLEYLDSNKISRDDVSASLSRIFNEMIFGNGAPLHCDPHGGNIAIRHNPKKPYSKHNFDVILYDHGLYRDIPTPLRRNYAKLWLAVLDANESQMRKYAYEVAGVDDEIFPLFASAITGRDYRAITRDEGLMGEGRNTEEKEAITDALGQGMLSQLVLMLGRVPRVILLILKTNDLTRSLDENLHTRQGPMRSFLILARYASRTVFQEEMEDLQGRGSILWPRNLFSFARTFSTYMRVKLQLGLYEWWLEIRRMAGFENVL